MSDHQSGWQQLRELIAEMWAAHRDPKDSNYNECEEAECAWCEGTRKALDELHTSGWQQRIAALEPWEDVGFDSEEQACFFCGNSRFVVEHPHGGHATNCLWQNAKDALPPSSSESRCDCNAHRQLREAHARDQVKRMREAGMRTGPELGGYMCVCGHCSHSHFKNHPHVRDGCSACNCTEFVGVPSEAPSGIPKVVAERGRDGLAALPPADVLDDIRHHLTEAWGALLFDPTKMPIEPLKTAITVAREQVDLALKLLPRGALPPAPEGSPAAPCGLCGGTGIAKPVTQAEKDEADRATEHIRETLDRVAGLFDCPDCLGVGAVFGGPCDTCRGTGKSADASPVRETPKPRERCTSRNPNDFGQQCEFAASAHVLHIFGEYAWQDETLAVKPPTSPKGPQDDA